MKTRRLVYVGIFSLLFTIQVRAQTSPDIEPALKSIVEIEDIRVLGSARVGDTFEIQVQYRTHLDIQANVLFRIPDHVSFQGHDSAVRSITEERGFRAGETRTVRFHVRADTFGAGLYTIHFTIPEALDGYNSSVERWIKIYSTDDGFDLFDPLNPGDRTPLEIGKDIQTFMGERPDRGKSNGQDMQTQSSQSYTVSVSGNIRFWSDEPSTPTYRGVYGNNVVLWFRNSSNPGTWYHPVYAANPVQGTHIDKLDDQGNFSFSFNFIGNLSGYDQVLVLVGASNDAAFMPAPPDGYISWSGDGYTSYYHESDGIVGSINSSHTTISINQENNNFPSDHGRVYRFLQQSREYVYALHNGTPPFTLSPIYTRIVSLSGASGIFCSNSECSGYPKQLYGPFILIDPVLGTQIKTISHEYGHKVNFRLWNSSVNKLGNAALALKEGWAEFFSFAVRNYANRNYGDDLLGNLSNAEIGPFFPTIIGRYANFSYLNIDRNVAAFACYLWNLYDDPINNTLLAAAYSNGDNDDIKGHSLRVFERMRTLGTTTVSNYHSHFKSGLLSEEQTSVNKVYNFMFDDLYGIPSSKMLSAQVDNFEFTTTSGQVSFYWQSKSYPSGYHANIESGYRLYRSAGSGWQLIQTLQSGATSSSYNATNIYGEYRITSFNSEGESHGAPFLSIPPPSPPSLSINTSGFSPELSWSSVSGATSYNIYAGSVAGAPGTVNCNSVLSISLLDATTSTSYTDYSVCQKPHRSA